MTYRIQFKRGFPRDIILHDIIAVDYCNGHLYFSDGNLTYCYHVDEIDYSEKIS
jgi:hypothetical protein